MLRTDKGKEKRNPRTSLKTGHYRGKPKQTQDPGSKPNLGHPRENRKEVRVCLIIGAYPSLENAKDGAPSRTSFGGATRKTQDPGNKPNLGPPTEKRKEVRVCLIIGAYPSLENAKDGAPSRTSFGGATRKTQDPGNKPNQAPPTEKRKEVRVCLIIGAYPSLENAKDGAPSSSSFGGATRKTQDPGNKPNLGHPREKRKEVRVQG